MVEQCVEVIIRQKTEKRRYNTCISCMFSGIFRGILTVCLLIFNTLMAYISTKCTHS